MELGCEIWEVQLLAVMVTHGSAIPQHQGHCGSSFRLKLLNSELCVLCSSLARNPVLNWLFAERCVSASPDAVDQLPWSTTKGCRKLDAPQVDARGRRAAASP